jgi:hypothetical protein
MTEPGVAPQRETAAATGPGEAFTTWLRRRDRCTRPLLTCSGRDGAALLLGSLRDLAQSRGNFSGGGEPAAGLLLGAPQ